VDRLGALRERNTVATIAKRVPWCELRETERKRDKWKNKERGAKEREREREERKERGTGRTSRTEAEERKKERNVRGGPKGQQKSEGQGGEGEGEGGSASFLRDASRLERTALRPSFSLPLDATYYARFPLAPSPPSR